MTDTSFGIVPAIHKDAQWQFLLINQISHQGNTHRFWTFPKGHPERGETPIQTARRELAEETGITAVKVVEDAQAVVQYSFLHEGVRIDKTVTYFLGICGSTDYTITDSREIADGNWYTAAEAMDKLAHANTKQVLKKIISYLEHNEM
jgi:8-oxo-dGTP pyrophosphatase MutT (NUDIX family)